MCDTAYSISRTWNKLCRISSSHGSGGGGGGLRSRTGSHYGGGSAGGGSSYGTNSEMCELSREDLADYEPRPPSPGLSVHMAKRVELVGPLASSAAERRATVLWQTLEDIGIDPHDGTGSSSAGSLWVN